MGAVEEAVTCINALGNEKHAAPRELYILGLFVSAVGVIMMAASHYTLNAFGRHYFSRLSGKVIRKQGWRFFGAIPRWVSSRRMKLWENLSTWLTVAALLLFGFYSFIFFLILISR